MASREKGRGDRVPVRPCHVSGKTGGRWAARAGHVGAARGPAPRLPRGRSESGPARAFTARPARAPVRRRHRGHGGGARPSPLRHRPGPRAPRSPRPERSGRAPRPQQPGHGGQGRRGREGRLSPPPRERRRRSGEDAGWGRAVRAERRGAAGGGRPCGALPLWRSPPLVLSPSGPLPPWLLPCQAGPRSPGSVRARPGSRRGPAGRAVIKRTRGALGRDVLCFRRGDF